MLSTVSRKLQMGNYWDIIPFVQSMIISFKVHTILSPSIYIAIKKWKLQEGTQPNEPKTGKIDIIISIIAFLPL